MLHWDFAKFESTLGFIFECLVLIFGCLVVIWDFTTTTLQGYGFGPEYQITRGVAYIFAVSFLSSLVRAPGEVFLKNNIVVIVESFFYRSFVGPI